MLPKPKVRPRLIHPTHKATLWKLDKAKTTHHPNINTLSDIYYSSENPVVFPCQYKIGKINGMERPQGSRIVGAFINDGQGYLLAHKDNVIGSDGKLLVSRGDLVKTLTEVDNPNIVTKTDMFVNDIIPIGQYDTAYLYRIVVEDREFDQTTAEPRKVNPR